MTLKNQYGDTIEVTCDKGKTTIKATFKEPTKSANGDVMTYGYFTSVRLAKRWISDIRETKCEWNEVTDLS